MAELRWEVAIIDHDGCREMWMLGAPVADSIVCMARSNQAIRTPGLCRPGGNTRTSGIIHEDVTVKAWDSYGEAEATIQYHSSKRLITHAGTTVRLFLAKAPSPTHGLTDESWLRAGGQTVDSGVQVERRRKLSI